MDELGFNKIAGAILATALGVMMIREVPHLLMHSSMPATPVYQVVRLSKKAVMKMRSPFPSRKRTGSLPWTRQPVLRPLKNVRLAIMPKMAARTVQDQIFGISLARKLAASQTLNIHQLCPHLA